MRRPFFNLSVPMLQYFYQQHLKYSLAFLYVKICASSVVSTFRMRALQENCSPLGLGWQIFIAEGTFKYGRQGLCYLTTWVAKLLKQFLFFNLIAKTEFLALRMLKRVFYMLLTFISFCDISIFCLFLFCIALC